MALVNKRKPQGSSPGILVVWGPLPMGSDLGELVPSVPQGSGGNFEGLHPLCCDRRALDFGGVPPRMPVASEGSGPRGRASEGTAAARGSGDSAGVSRGSSGKHRSVDLKVGLLESTWVVFLPGTQRCPASPPSLWLDSLALLRLTLGLLAGPWAPAAGFLPRPSPPLASDRSGVVGVLRPLL